jgi:ring-1,2-phenylacetyl-CoA epoxidase subunit PaaB
MTDTQWPVYQVFERPSRNGPMQAAGSVHAADPEMALQSARDVFGRRPTSVDLWVVPRSVIYSKTRQELEGLSPAPDERPGEETYCVFRKTAAGVDYEEAKSVRASSAEAAMARAVAQAADREIHAWWVFPAAAIISHAAASGAPSLKPQPNKWFRDQKSFPVLNLLRELRAKVPGTKNES